MFQAIFAHLPALLFALALGAGLLGLLVWAMALQGAASRRTAQVLWGLALLLALSGFFSGLLRP
ncbi:MAG: hypothetical protein NZ849_11580 [Meiothermus sp.]|uniref:hypothetical protein n=1 Tax=Thermaceae TaxID=188786 RepID=UPI0025D19C89|nr:MULTISPECIES: hypothetical protein [Thermaceae]MCS7059096.1 hypothetical protein [Meiothermus sp.]MCS7195532.1 hypothetical protein [Meiothermus sp.]MCX7850301.1 hypothetical protein [Thermus sp.]MDW8090460.1 hypothetical protein [Meiothermus sp.]MDW8481039.1 hypothetical protein [Meiothermus sp.]